MSDVPPAAVAAAEPEPILSYGKPCKPSVHRRWKGAATRQLLELTAIKNWHCIACGNLNTNNARTCKNQECACPRNSADLVQWGMAHPDHAGQFRRPRVYAEPPKEMEAPRNELLANILNAIKNGSTHNGNVKVFARRPARPSSMENGYQSIELDNSFALQHLGKICPAGTQLNKLADEKGVAFVNVNAHKGDIHVDILPGELHVLRGEKVVYLAPNTKRFKLGLIQEKGRSTHFKIDKNYRGDPFANWLKVTVKEGMALVIPSNVLHFVESIPNSVGVSIKVTNCLAEEDLQKNLLHFLLIEMIDLTQEDDEEEAVDNKEAATEQEGVLEDPITQTMAELTQVNQEIADLRVIFDRLMTRLQAQMAGRDINRLPTAVSDDSNKNSLPSVDSPPAVAQQDLVPTRNGEATNNADDSNGKGPKGNLSAGHQAENKDDNPLKPAAAPPKAANLKRTNNNPPGRSNAGTGEPAAKRQRQDPPEQFAAPVQDPPEQFAAPVPPTAPKKSTEQEKREKERRELEEQKREQERAEEEAKKAEKRKQARLRQRKFRDKKKQENLELQRQVRALQTGGYSTVPVMPARYLVARVNQGNNSNAAAATRASAPTFGAVVMAPPPHAPQPQVAAAPNEEDEKGSAHSKK